MMHARQILLRWMSPAFAVFLAQSGAPPAAAQCVVQEITAPPGTRTPNSYGSVATAGDVLVVGDHGDYDKEIAARAYVYRRVDGVWRYETTLMDPDAGKETAFFHPATDGEVILVGASQADGAYPFSGAVHAWRFNGTEWVYEQRLYPDGKPGYSFGFSLDMERDVAIIGARDDSFDGFTQAGSAFVFRYDHGERRWQQEQKLHASTPATYELFGMSVDIHDDRIIVGANGVDNGRGAAYVFRNDGAKWIGEAELQAPDGKPHDLFGWGVYAGADIAAAGAIDAATRYGPSAGAAYTFVHQDVAWQPEAKLVPATPSKPSDEFGVPIKSTAGGETLLVGCFLDSFGASHAGSVFLFRREGGRWFQTGKIGDPDPNPSGGFGFSIDVNGDQSIITAFNGLGGGNGNAFVYDGIHQRDCDGDGVVDACEDVPGPDWAVIPASCIALADLDGDGSIGTSDVALLLSEWGRCSSGCAADLDADGDVDGYDLGYLLGSWGPVAMQ